MEHQGDKTTSAIVNFAPDGDIILVVGPEMKRFRVHSLFLKVASKPFYAMFKWEWQEGQDLLHRDGPKEIELPADNAAALETILAIIHHQHNEIARSITASQVLEVAIVADKYDFLGAVKFASEVLLRIGAKDPSDQMRLVAAAYLFRDARAFKEITKALVLNYHGSYLDLACDEVESAMSWRVFCLLEAQRSYARSEFCQVLLEEMDSGKCAHGCDFTCRYTYPYLKSLEKYKLWPKKLCDVSLSKAINLVESMPDPIHETESGGCCHSNFHTPSWPYKAGPVRQLKFLCEKFGLCLTCVRDGVTATVGCDHDDD
ncbi:hypothetical protein EAE99_005342 [Botrytis elliptica]|nr:hypothetical protein EAE99_005342 [Botrytis elliptica]